MCIHTCTDTEIQLSFRQVRSDEVRWWIWNSRVPFRGSFSMPHRCDCWSALHPNLSSKWLEEMIFIQIDGFGAMVLIDCNTTWNTPHTFDRWRPERLKLKSWLRKCDKVGGLYWQRLKASCCWRRDPSDGERWLVAVATRRLEVRGWVMESWGSQQSSAGQLGHSSDHFSLFGRGLWHSSDTLWTGKLTSRSFCCCREDGLPNQVLVVGGEWFGCATAMGRLL